MGLQASSTIGRVSGRWIRMRRSSTEWARSGWNPLTAPPGTSRPERMPIPSLNARTSGVYWRADPDDISILDGRDDQKRAALIAERLTQWKSVRNA